MTWVHINRPTGHYIGQHRARGFRLYQTVTKKHGTAAAALAEAARRMGNETHRIRVLFIDASGYYEPHVVFEGKRGSLR